MVQEGVFQTELPCVASHEGSGTVVKVGAGVKDFKVGDRVMCGIPYHLCGKCVDCTGPETYRQYCRNHTGHSGVMRDGFFAEYAVVDSATSAKLPENVSFKTAAPLACAGCTIFRGLKSTELKKGNWLAIVGSGGGLGHLGIQFAKAFEWRVIGIDARDEALELSKKAGADMVLDARVGDEKLAEEIQKVTEGLGADATINVSGADSAAATACAVTKMHGLMIQIAQVCLL
jgi:propanol-preferring alcohol dehydrogenase